MAVRQDVLLRQGRFETAFFPVQRFPLTFLCIAALFALHWTAFDGAYVLVPRLAAERVPYGYLDRLQAAASALTPFFVLAATLTFAAALAGESLGRRRISLAPAFAGVALLALVHPVSAVRLLLAPSWTIISPADVSVFKPWIALPPISYLFLSAALALFLLLSPYLRLRAHPAAFWQFNHKLGAGLVAAIAGASLAYAGFAATVETARLLFQVAFPATIYAKAAVAAVYFVAPAIWLTLTPGDFLDEPRTGPAKEFTSRSVALLVKFIFIPVAAALSVLLAAYIVLVSVNGHFETARLGFRSLLYGAGIVLVALFAYPDRADSRIVRLFWRAWPWLLVPPIILIFPSLWVRITEYGWTQYRYFAFLAGVWITLIAFLATVFRLRDDLRIVPGVLGVLLVAGSFGAWGAPDTVGRSQRFQLERLLTANGMLKDGRWQEATPVSPWAYNQRLAVEESLRELVAARQLHRLEPWFEGRADNPFPHGETASYDALRLKLNIGIAVAPIPAPAPMVSFTSRRPAVLRVEGASSVIGPIQLWYAYLPVQALEITPIGRAELGYDGHIFSVLDRSGKSIRFDLDAFLTSVAGTPAAGPSDNIAAGAAKTLEGDGDLPVKLAVVNLSRDVSPRARISGEVYLIFASPAPP